MKRLLLIASLLSLCGASFAADDTPVMDYSQHLSRIHGKSLWLSREERVQLAAEINDPAYLQHLEDWQRYMVADATFGLLRKQADGASDVGPLLADIVLNEKLHRYIRDYALQHYGQWAHARPASDDEQAFLWERTADVDDVRAGTALMALQRIKQAGKLTGDPKRLADRCAEILSEPEVAPESRMPALGIYADEQGSAALPHARRFIERPHPLVLRVVAMGVLARVGNEGDREYLSRIKNDRDDEGREIAASAMSVIEERAKL